MVSNAKSRKFRKSRSQVLHKPGGVIHPRVQAVDPQHFAILCVDCAKNRSKIMLADFYGRVLLHPTTIEHDGAGVARSHPPLQQRPLDQRIAIDDNGTRTWTVYDDSSADAEPYADFNSSGGLTQRYLSGMGVVNGAVVDELLARTNPSGTTAWYLTDKLGSVRDIVSSTGTELDHIVYDSFGNIVTETDAANGDRFKYAGMEYDSTTGQYYDRARDYDSVTGRFMGLDPVGLRLGVWICMSMCTMIPRLLRIIRATIRLRPGSSPGLDEGRQTGGCRKPGRENKAYCRAHRRFPTCPKPGHRIRRGAKRPRLRPASGPRRATRAALRR